MHKAERGLFDLMRGRPIQVASSDRASERALVAAVEGITPEHLEQLRSLGSGALRLAVTPHRARAMGATSAISGLDTNGTRATALSLELDPGATADQILRLTTSTADAPLLLRNPRPASPLELSGLALARSGHLLPAIVTVAVADRASDALDALLADGTILAVPSAEILRFTAPEHQEVTPVTEAAVPLREAEDARFVLFREIGGLLEHVAILVGDREQWRDPVPVRIHSACLTGDLFGSLRCDCGEQLLGSLRIIAARPGGVLLYLSQEGRGIGLGNKLRAYSLQQEGLDTVDADCALGFGADERTYGAAVQILRHLEIERIQLLTNNPEKVRAMQRGGIEVTARRPIHGTLNRHNLPYVRAKAQRAGHFLQDMLSKRVGGG